MKPRLLFVSNLFPDREESYRGLDNATILHQLQDRWHIDVIALRPVLIKRNGWTPREEDSVFHPTYLPIKYLPKIGGIANHHLASTALIQHAKKQNLQDRYEVIVGSWLYPDGYAVAQLAELLNLPFALIAQGSDVHGYLKSPWRKQAILKAVSKASAVITRSHSLAKLLHQAGCSDESLVGIHNGVDLETFYPLETPSYDDKTKNLLFVGNLLPVKNPQLLLDSFAKACHQLGDIKSNLTIVGKGPLLPNLQKQVSSLGIQSQVHFAGPLEAQEVAKCMRQSDLLVMSSRNEGLPNVVLEALASGLRVVATDVGGIHEVIDAPWKGKLVSDPSPSALAQAIVEVLKQKPDHSRLLQHAKSLSWSQTSDEYHSTLTSLLN